jgi:hypothetical protein
VDSHHAREGPLWGAFPPYQDLKGNVCFGSRAADRRANSDRLRRAESAPAEVVSGRTAFPSFRDGHRGGAVLAGARQFPIFAGAGAAIKRRPTFAEQQTYLCRRSHRKRSRCCAPYE